jgi:hypothetical protein
MLGRSKRSRRSSSSTAELELYLTCDLKWRETGENFDILKWLGENENKSPVVALMTKEILVIPVLTVVVEQDFNTGENILSETHSRMVPEIVEVQSYLDD